MLGLARKIGNRFWLALYLSRADLGCAAFFTAVCYPVGVSLLLPIAFFSLKCLLAGFLLSVSAWLFIISWGGSDFRKNIIYAYNMSKLEIQEYRMARGFKAKFDAEGGFKLVK